MNTAQLKKELYQYIENADEKLLHLVYGIFIADNNNYIFPGEPMNETTLKERVRAAKERIRAGQFTTQENLEKEMEEW